MQGDTREMPSIIPVLRIFSMCRGEGRGQNEPHHKQVNGPVNNVEMEEREWASRSRKDFCGGVGLRGARE